MELLCECGKTLVVAAIRLEGMRIVMLLKRCPTCAEQHYQEGYEAGNDEKHAPEYCDRCLQDVRVCRCDAGPGHWPTIEGTDP